jgi:hypothetical protein
MRAMSEFALFCKQQTLFKNALLEYDPTIWFPKLRGKFEEDVPSNWFICFVPTAWGYWKINYGVHFGFLYARANSKHPAQIRLAIGVENPMKEQFKEAFKEEVISRINTRKIEYSGFTLTAQKRKKLLEMDPVSFDSESWHKILQKYIVLHPIIDIIGVVSREYSRKGAFDPLIQF